MGYTLLFLTDGFEEIEALATVDVLRRAEIPVQTVSLTGSLAVTGSHGIQVLADVMFSDAPLDGAQAAVLPGGTPRINDHEGLRAWLPSLASRGGVVAAICAAPMVPGTLGLLRGRRATCYPGFEGYLEGATLVEGAAVVEDGNFITGRGPALSIDFALALVARLAGSAAARKVAGGLLADYKG